jgi:hypothetical protein
MLLLVTGASGVGKTTARIHAAKLLDPTFEAVELWHLGPIPAVPTVRWRQQQVDVAVRRATELSRQGRHLLLAGDPIPAGEVLAVPSAGEVDVAVCLLDADARSQSARLDARNDPSEVRDLHLNFAHWMRVHAVDPSYIPEAVTTDSWEQMQWDRWVGRRPGPEWAMTVLDTTGVPAEQVGEAVADWCRRAVRGKVPTFSPGWHLPGR